MGFFSQNLLELHPIFFREGWSISVEEWFYLSLPILLISSVRLAGNLRQGLLVVIGLFLLIGPLARWWQFEHRDPMSDEYWDLYIRCTVLTRIDSLAIGIMGAYLCRYCPNKWLLAKRPKFVLGILLCLSPVVLKLWGWYPRLEPSLSSAVFYHCFEPMGTFLMLPFLSTWRRGPSRFTSFVTHVSIVSYAMYLLNHSLIALALIPLIQRCFMPAVLGVGWQLFLVGLFWLICLFFSTVFYKFYEAPCTRLRDRLRFPWERSRHSSRR